MRRSIHVRALAARPFLFAALVLALVAGSAILAPRFTTGQPASGGISVPIDESETVWWSAIGESSCAVLNLGPLLDLDGGQSVRRWTLMMHRPGTEQRLSCLQGIAQYDDVGAITAEGSGFRIAIEPRAGFSWGSVLDTDALVASLEGFD